MSREKILQFIQPHKVRFPGELDRAFNRYVRSDESSDDFRRLLDKLVGYAEMYENYAPECIAYWINIFFAYIMHPLECSNENWQDHTDELLCLLKIQDIMLSVIDREFIYTEGKEDNCRQLGRTDVFRQNKAYFFALTYWYSGNMEDFVKYTEEVIEHTKRNIARLLHSDNAEELFSEEYDKDDFYIHGARYWQEPLAWQVSQALWGEYERELIPFYESYVSYLKSITACEHWTVLNGLISNAESELFRLCDFGREMAEMELSDKKAEVMNLKDEIARYDRILGFTSREGEG